LLGQRRSALTSIDLPEPTRVSPEVATGFDAELDRNLRVWVLSRQYL
jgi:hypothetical protein